MIIRRTPRGVAALIAAGSLLLAGLASVGAPGSATAHQRLATGTTCIDQDHHRVRAGSSRPDPNSISTAKVNAISEQVDARVRKLPPLARYQLLRPTKLTTIKVYANLLYDPDVRGSMLSPSVVDRQIDVLNAAYRSSFFQFELVTSTPRSNANWYYWDEDEDDAAAKGAYHRGTKADLNLYFVKMQPGLLGYATFPGGTLARDGVVLDVGTPPGGGTSGYNQGDTAVHEIGHWLGLYHTFQGGCSFLNDGIADTPAQADGNNVYLCSVADTCTTYAGTDPIHNYMGYGNDVCMTGFTANQGFRMRQVWAASRAPSSQT